MISKTVLYCKIGNLGVPRISDNANHHSMVSSVTSCNKHGTSDKEVIYGSSLIPDGHVQVSVPIDEAKQRNSSFLRVLQEFLYSLRSFNMTKSGSRRR